MSGFTSVGPRAFWPNVNKMDNLQLADNFSWIKGNHTFKVGAEYRRTQIPRSPSRFRRGRFQYNGVYTAERPNDPASRGATGNSVADGLLRLEQQRPLGLAERRGAGHPLLGLLLSGRLEAQQQVDAEHRPALRAFPDADVPPTLGNHTLNSTVVRFIGEANGRPIDPGERIPANRGGWGEAEYLPHFRTPESGSDCACQNDKNNFAPRIGIAYRVNDSTVVRVGAGLFYGEHDNTGGESARFNTGAPQSNEFDNAQPRDVSTFFHAQRLSGLDPGGAAARRLERQHQDRGRLAELLCRPVVLRSSAGVAGQHAADGRLQTAPRRRRSTARSKSTAR